MVPKNLTELLLTLTCVVPGFVYQSVRIAIRGRLPTDVELSTRLVRAIVTSAFFALFYLLVFGEALVNTAQDEQALFHSVRVAAGCAFVGGIGLPALVAALSGLLKVPDWGWLNKLRGKLSEIPRYDSIPTAWDKIFQDQEPVFVRVLNSEGRWVAGYYGTNSYASSYPEAHEIYLERAHSVAEDGAIGDEIPGTKGCIVNCADLQLLELLRAGYEDDSGEGGTPQ